jgi:DASS family divalent anion:Na+ symporter
MSIEESLIGYADPVVWLVLGAFFISRGMIKTGLGRRIAFLFIKAIGHYSLGLAYALISTEAVLGAAIPSTGARSGGIIFPITKSLAEAYESRPGASARRLGAYLMTTVAQGNIIVCAMWLTGQASNPIIAKLAKETTGLEITYARWITAAILPAIVSLVFVPLLIYKIYPPEIRHTPAASEFASDQLRKLGKMHYATVALIGICVLLLSGILSWEDLITEREAWSVFIWYGGLLRMAEALGETGITKRFAESAAGLTLGWSWWIALGVLLLIYFYAHYSFASITAHATAMYTPFLLVILAAGTPPWLAILSLAYFSNLGAAVTHYGTTASPIYFGAGYVSQKTWWLVGLAVSALTITIWTVVGFTWWKILRLW